MHGHIVNPAEQNPGSGHRARLRKRLFEGGPKALLDHELIEYLLALAIPRRDTKSQAKELIARFGGIGWSHSGSRLLLYSGEAVNAAVASAVHRHQFRH